MNAKISNVFPVEIIELFGIIFSPFFVGKNMELSAKKSENLLSLPISLRDSTF
jgi:hypothetical protein